MRRRHRRHDAWSRLRRGSRESEVSLVPLERRLRRHRRSSRRRRAQPPSRLPHRSGRRRRRRHGRHRRRRCRRRRSESGRAWRSTRRARAETHGGGCKQLLCEGTSGCRSRGESDHNGSAVAFTWRSSHSCNNTHRNGSPGLIGPLTLSLTKCLWTLTWCLLTPRVDAGRREGAECAINILRSRMCSTFRCASLRGLRALFHRAAASVGHRPVERG